MAGTAGGLIGWPPGELFNALGTGLLARAVGWGLVGAVIGICPGIATRDRKRVLRGLLGGFVGAFVCGVLFDAVGYLIAAGDETFSRVVADVTVGACVGFLVALVEVVARDA